MRKAILITAMTITMILFLGGCGGDGEEAVPTEAVETTAAEEMVDEQNPIMNFVGPYVSDRATVNVEADGQAGVKVTVSWASGASEYSEWVMTGTFDEETKTFEYHDCVKTDTVYDEDGNVTSEEEVYTGGHGFMFFEDGDKLTLTWQDDQEDAGKDLVFTFDPNMA